MTRQEHRTADYIKVVNDVMERGIVALFCHYCYLVDLSLEGVHPKDSLNIRLKTL
jgi:hypothetical protein